ncbi:glycosyltransferase [Nostoc sp. ChiSLP03a]|uniref:glycosyltransferase n=1 Tax=Nostoc sp. ChiSLP03a TaxID=3075380 RepID=UPI002AD45B6E|nr:glycosyltransferase [Nostoc sp. ChiSLP03a]MDZ8210515.1 glycosyltransferase [Nostoc sp. ChiSLP03a]
MTLNTVSNVASYSVKYLYSVNMQESWLLIKQLVSINKQERISVFFFLIQLDYLVLALVLKIISKFFSKNLEVSYLMHEPKFEKGRINPFKAYIVFLYHLVFGYIADKILLPSNEAFLKAKDFVNNDKLYKLNLSFISLPEEILQNNLAQLKYSWDKEKTFLLLGRADRDKNPQGFLFLASIINKNYPKQARFIWAGSERNIQVNYDEKLIIRFPGFISNSAKSFLLGLSHFVVIPYSFSTQSGVVTEALSYGKLLIINDIPTFSYLKGLSFVFFTDFNDKSSMSKCIHDVFSMDINDYETRYWEAIRYFKENHSEAYLSKTLQEIL